MKCPGCQHVISGAGAFCGYCGHKYSAEFQSELSLYLELKADLDKLRSIAKNDFAAGIERLSQKIEKRYGGEGKRAAPAPAKPESFTYSPDKGMLDAAAPNAAETSAPVLTPKEQKLGEESIKQYQAASRPVTPEKDKKAEDLNFETAMGQKWLLIIGVVATVFGVGYFLKYSFDQGWIGPAGRVAMAYAWGAAFLFGGNIFRKRNMETFGLNLAGGGIATLYFATFAAFQMYKLIGQAPAFLLMVMVTALAGLLAVMYDTKWMAVLGLIGGFLTPALLGTGQDSQIALMSYMTILNLGMLGVAFYKKWNLLTVLGFFFTYLLYSGWYSQYYAPEKFWPAIIFLNIFYLIYSIMPFITKFVRKEQVGGGGFAVIIPNSFIAFGYSYYMVKAHFSVEAVGLVSMFYAAVFLFMATHVLRAGKQDTEGFAVLVGKALIFLVVTVPLVFSKNWITVFWSAQALAAIWIGIRLGNRSMSRAALLLFFITACKYFLHDYPSVFCLSGDFRIVPLYGHLFMERWITAVVFFGSLFFAADLARRKGLSVTKNPDSRVHPVIYVAFGFLLFIFLNMETSSFFHDNLPAARFAGISVLWALFSVATIILGFKTASPGLRKTALVLFMATIIKVFIFDMGNISTPYRIISFIMLGLILVGTSFLYHKYKRLLVPAPETQDKGEAKV
ncbi:MAG: hypothetical protein A3J79_06780 [Elusimicrobia bacterium RIFOXYB2_FULL_62_6]|nr:MAG: hypothetical protein A3J79_06780 [Elusimicrobia bacterium RIFOXYB2_FULL_62_6]